MEEWLFKCGSVSSTWMTESVVSDWTSYSYSQNKTSSGNQFFRTQLMRMQSCQYPPSYLAKFRYSQGIIVYMNGMEVFRDNMDKGAIFPSSSPVSSYSSIEYRGYIRSFSDLMSSTIVVAVGLFFSPLHPSSQVEFDGYIQALGESSDGFFTPIVDGISMSGETDCIDGVVATSCEMTLAFVLPSLFQVFVTGFVFQLPVSAFSPQQIEIVGYQSVLDDGKVIWRVSGDEIYSEGNCTIISIRQVISSYKQYYIRLVTNVTDVSLFLNKVHPVVGPNGRHSIYDPDTPKNDPATSLPTPTPVPPTPSCKGFNVRLTVTPGVYSNNRMIVNVGNQTDPHSIWKYDSSFSTEKEMTVCIRSTVVIVQLGGDNETSWSEGALFTMEIIGDYYSIEVYSGFYSIQLPILYEEIIHLDLVISPGSSWWTASQIDSLPVNWEAVSHPDWTVLSYPFENTQSSIQVYQKEFSFILSNSMNFLQLGVRFRFGCSVYLNGRMVFEQGMNTASQSTISPFEPTFIETSIPLIISEGMSNKRIVTSGVNLISVVITNPPTYHQADFDCYLFVNHQSLSLLNTQHAVLSNQTNITRVFSLDPNSVFIPSNVEEALELSFDHDKRVLLNEISLSSSLRTSLHGPTSIMVHGYNRGEEESRTLLLSVSNIVYWTTGQTKIIRFPSFTAYNTYVFTGFTSDSNTTIQLSLGLFTKRQDIPQGCSYHSIVGYVQHTLLEVVPDCLYFRDFSIYPPLPDGLMIDSVTGTIVGTPTILSPLSFFTISAMIYNETLSTTMVIPLTILDCFQSSHVSITIHCTLDSQPYQQGLLLTSSQLSWSRLSFEPSELTSVSWSVCLNPGIYSVSLLTRGNSLDQDISYQIIMNDFTLPLATGLMRDHTIQITLPLTMPFLQMSTLWKYRVADSIPSWYLMNYESSSWYETRESSFSGSQGSYLYLRTTLSVKEIGNEKVLYLGVIYQGGFIAYLNEVCIARYFVKSEFDKSSTCDILSSLKQAHITIPLQRVSYHSGDTILAVKVFKPIGSSSDYQFHFVVAGVYNYDEYALLIDDIEDSSVGSPTTSRKASKAFDHDTNTSIQFDFARYSFIEFAFMNKAFVMFNYFGLDAEHPFPFEWIIRGGYFKNNYYDLSSGMFLDLNRTSSRLAYTPAGMLPYDRYYFQVSSYTKETRLSLYEFSLFYRTRRDTPCEEKGWPFVYDLEYSVLPCGNNYEGMQYRVCSGGHFGPVINTSCVLQESSYFTYGKEYHLLRNVEIERIVPKYDSYLFFFSVSPSLPKGLTLDSETGIISGAADCDPLSEAFTVTGVNERSMISTKFTLIVTNAACEDADSIPYPYGAIRRSSCSERGAYVGVVVKQCVSHNGMMIWEDVRDSCMTVISLLAVGVVAFFIVVLFLVFVRVLVNFNDQEELYIRELRDRKKRIQELHKESQV